MLKNNDCPCTKDCPDRSPTCHGTCPKYKAWVEKREAKKKAAAVDRERYALTHSQKKAYQRASQRKSTGVFKKFPS